MTHWLLSGGALHPATHVVAVTATLLIGVPALILAIHPNTRNRDRPLLGTVVAMCAGSLVLTWTLIQWGQTAAEVSAR